MRLDLLQKGANGGGPPRPSFQVASADGTVVFFTDSRHLTKTASPEGRDLYRCQIPVGESAGGCATLTDVSAPLKGTGESAMVQGQVAAASEDGSRVYFVATAVLDTEPNGQGDTATPKQPNLYLSEEGAGVRFIATLSKEDFPVWGGPSAGDAAEISADASPDGRYLAFTSQQSPTGGETENAQGEAVTEAYLYDAEASDQQLQCVSCNPTGAAAVGELIPNRSNVPYDPAGLWPKRRAAATLPEATSTTSEEIARSLYRPRAALNNGRLFFNSIEALVPADSNGAWDVYQYEPLGVGSCSASTQEAASVRSGAGCVGLLSSGSSEGDSGFLDATPSGDVIFFLTPGRLSVLDTDQELYAYDARVDGVEAQLPDLS